MSAQVVVAGVIAGTTQELAVALGAGTYAAQLDTWTGELVVVSDTFAHFAPQGTR